jgi:hypothetical protein
MGSNVQTIISPQQTEVYEATVIKFIDPPLYRSNNVDLTNGDMLELFSISRLTKGKNQGGLRAKVCHVEIPSGRCEVIIENRDFEVLVNYSGVINAGIEGY